jgi:hypothetical protein
MKSVKIILAVLVVGFIAFFVINSLEDTPEKAKVAAAGNQFRENIEKEITALRKLPNTKFSKDSYNGIKSLIDDYYKPHPPQHPYGRLGKSQLENDQWKENFSKNLYSAYAVKFIDQADYVFIYSNWQNTDLSFIRNECKILRGSQYLDSKSPVNKSLIEIQQILAKYDEINNFITTSKYFSFSNTSLPSEFPFSDIKVKIARIDTYKRNNLENKYVNNCARLHNELNTNKNRLIDSYLTYLDTKIYKWTGKYKQFQFTSFNEYQSIIYDPLKKELEDFKINCNNNNYTYDNNRYMNISNRLNADRKEAYLNL